MSYPRSAAELPRVPLEAIVKHLAKEVCFERDKIQGMVGMRKKTCLF